VRGCETAQANLTLSVLQIRRPAVYDYKLPVGFADKMPDLANWLKGSYDHNPDTSSVELRTAGGRTFRDHAKVSGGWVGMNK
jgi:hypothetical protein